MTDHEPTTEPLTTLDRSVAGLVALVTGAGSGMGRATARLLASEGVAVAVTDVDGDAACREAEAIVEAGATAHPWTLDVTSTDEVEAVVDEVAARFGGLDLVINNAGIACFVAIDDADYAERWHLSIDVLLTAHTRVIRAVLPHLRRSACPRIVNIASTEGWGATRLASPYTAAKHGVIGLTKSLAVELGRDGITVNCICPGPIDTAMTAAIDPSDKATFARRRTALGRYGLPEEVAHGTMNFCLPASGYMTGAILPVDGGLLIRNA